MENEDQDMAGNYDVHIPFKPNKVLRYRIRIVEPEYDEETVKKISEAHELAKRKTGESVRESTK